MFRVLTDHPGSSTSGLARAASVIRSTASRSLAILDLWRPHPEAASDQVHPLPSPGPESTSNATGSEGHGDKAAASEPPSAAPGAPKPPVTPSTQANEAATPEAPRPCPARRPAPRRRVHKTERTPPRRSQGRSRHLRPPCRARRTARHSHRQRASSGRWRAARPAHSPARPGGGTYGHLRRSPTADHCARATARDGFQMPVRQRR